MLKMSAIRKKKKTTGKRDVSVRGRKPLLRASEHTSLAEKGCRQSEHAHIPTARSHFSHRLSTGDLVLVTQHLETSALCYLRSIEVEMGGLARRGQALLLVHFLSTFSSLFDSKAIDWLSFYLA